MSGAANRRRGADADTWRTFADRREALRRAVEHHPAGRRQR